jgi:CheY-like chemotaxis protein
VSDKKTILVIDDVEENVEIVQKRLEHDGFSVVAAFDGEEGLNQMKRHKPDLVLCDIMLPKKDGWEVLESAHKDPDLNRIPVILMTAYTTIQFRGERDRAKELGAVDYLKKPFDLSEMSEMVKRHLGVQ